MIIHSGIIILDYNPSYDILDTSMPDIRQFGMSEVSYCLNLIIDSVRNYDIKYLLLDSSKSLVEVNSDSYKDIINKFGIELMNTRLKKIARIGTSDATREENSLKLSKEIREELNLPILFRNFSNKAEAMDWLKEN